MFLLVRVLSTCNQTNDVTVVAETEGAQDLEFGKECR